MNRYAIFTFFFCLNWCTFKNNKFLPFLLAKLYKNLSFGQKCCLPPQKKKLCSIGISRFVVFFSFLTLHPNKKVNIVWITSRNSCLHFTKFNNFKLFDFLASRTQFAVKKQKPNSVKTFLHQRKKIIGFSLLIRKYSSMFYLQSLINSHLNLE